MSEEELARLLQESLRIAHKSGALRTEDLKRAMVRLGALAHRQGVKLRQSYVRVGKLALMKSQRYAHAKQFRRAAAPAQIPAHPPGAGDPRRRAQKRR